MNLEEWMKRELDDIYVSTLIMKEKAYKRINGVPKKQDIYIFMGLNLRGYKKIIDIVVPEEDTTSYWFKKFNEFKSRGISELFMVAMLDNEQMNRALKMVYSETIRMPSMIEFYNNSRPYILQKNHRNLMSEMQKIYKSSDMNEAEKRYKDLKNKYKNEKLLIIIIEKYIKEILPVIKYSKEARAITSYTFSYLKIRSKLGSLINEYNVYEDNESIRKYVSDFMKKEEEKFKPSKRNWSIIVNEMDSVITRKILEKL